MAATAPHTCTDILSICGVGVVDRPIGLLDFDFLTGACSSYDVAVAAGKKAHQVKSKPNEYAVERH